MGDGQSTQSAGSTVIHPCDPIFIPFPSPTAAPHPRRCPTTAMTTPTTSSLVSLCARRLVAHLPSARRSLPLLPAELYPALLQAALLDCRVPLLQDLVRSWPFPILSLRCDPHRHPDQLCVQAVLLAVTAGLRSDAGPRPCLRVLDMTGIQDGAEHGPDSVTLWSRTVLLAKACLEASQRRTEPRGTKDQKGSPVPAVEIRVDLFVNSTSGAILRAALRGGGALRLRCRDFHAEELSLGGTLDLLEALEPLGLRRVELRFNNLGLAGLCQVVPRLARFPHLASLRLPYSNVDVRRPGMEDGLKELAEALGSLHGLRELNLGSCRLAGRLGLLLGSLRRPLESLELPFCHLQPCDLAFLAGSPHAPALKKLDLSGHDLSSSLLPPFLHLLPAVSSSLRHLDAAECHLGDRHLPVLLPPLRLCVRLSYLGLFGNRLSSAGLKVLLEGTRALSSLRLVVHPYPTDCCDSGDGDVREGCVAALREELQGMLGSAGREDEVWSCSLQHHGGSDFFAL
ncbi:leucine-rich repeat-containing protein 14 [Tympanuchus pallidicinctus]|uniref:leucine-rich repeat-containing protein 14 n=1 Tax=Tympanuchus pallidicinctus TaxID=109042 RepID=UPI0022875EE6|nr:leucine-rich repeat-containing protein 14 [Tympanuchus pallidicinctus]